MAWENRRSIIFKFRELGMMMTVAPMSGAQVEIQIGNNSSYAAKDSLKILKLKDVPTK